MVILSIFLRHKGSAESKPVDAPNASNERAGNENSVRGNAHSLRRAGRDGDGPDDLKTML